MILFVKIFPHADQQDLLRDLPDGISGKLNQFFRHNASFFVRKHFLIHDRDSLFNKRFDFFCRMWDLSSPTRDGTLAPCIGR